MSIMCSARCAMIMHFSLLPPKHRFDIFMVSDWLYINLLKGGVCVVVIWMCTILKTISTTISHSLTQNFF